MDGKFCYRVRGEQFEGSFDTREDAALEFAALYPVNVYEGKCSVETGVCRVPRIEALLPDIAECMIEAASESDGGEWSDSWATSVAEEGGDLQARVARAVCEWADEHKCHPDWFDVDEVEETTVEVCDE